MWTTSPPSKTSRFSIIFPQKGSRLHKFPSEQNCKISFWWESTFFHLDSPIGNAFSALLQPQGTFCTEEQDCNFVRGIQLSQKWFWSGWKNEAFISGALAATSSKTFEPDDVWKPLLGGELSLQTHRLLDAHTHKHTNTHIDTQTHMHTMLHTQTYRLQRGDSVVGFDNWSLYFQCCAHSRNWRSWTMLRWFESKLILQEWILSLVGLFQYCAGTIAEIPKMLLFWWKDNW